MQTTTKSFTGFFAAAIALAALLLPRASNLPSNAVAPRTITVSGEAEMRVVPDEVLLTLGVETWDPDLDTAKSINDQRVRKVLALIEIYGIPAKYVQTDHVSIEPIYDMTHYRNVLKGYYVRKTIVLTLRDLTKFEDLLAGVIEAGANYVHGIQFRTTDLRQHRDEARALAINAAREKAQAMAGELNQTIGLPQTVHEDHIGWWSWYGSGWWGSRWSSAVQNVVQEAAGNFILTDEGMAPGQISVTARVTVTFELTP